MKLLKIEEVQALLLDLMKDVHDFLTKNCLQYYLLGGSALGAVRHGGFIPWDDDIDIGMTRENYDAFLKIANQFNSKYEVVNYQKTPYCDYGLTRIYIPDTYIHNPSIEKTKLDKRLYFDIFPLDNVPDDVSELKEYEKKIVKFKRKILLLDARRYNNSYGKYLVKKVIAMGLSPFRRNTLSSFDKLLKKYEHCETARICSLCSQYSFKKQVMMKEIYGTPVLHRFEDTEFFLPEKVDLYLTTLFGSNYMEIPPIEKRRKGFDIYVLED